MDLYKRRFQMLCTALEGRVNQLGDEYLSLDLNCQTVSGTSGKVPWLLTEMYLTYLGGSFRLFPVPQHGLACQPFATMHTPHVCPV